MDTESRKAGIKVISDEPSTAASPFSTRLDPATLAVPLGALVGLILAAGADTPSLRLALLAVLGAVVGIRGVLTP